MKLWKITNTSQKPAQDVKLSIRKTITETVGIVLKPGQFVICIDQMTSALDAQERRRLLTVDRDFVNKYNLSVGVNHNQSDLDSAIKNAKAYTSTVKETNDCVENDPADHFEI